MVITKNSIEDWIKCNYLFGKNIITEKYTKVVKDDEYGKYLKALNSIAHYELKNMDKLSLIEYRTRFTTENPSLFKINDRSFIAKLNSIFQTFAENAFVAYNLPVEIPIDGTNLIYRYLVNFLLIDENKNLTIVEFQDLNDLNLTKQKMRFWAHCIIPYSFISNTFNKNVTVIIIDPVLHSRFDMIVKPERFNSDKELLNLQLKGIHINSLIKNFSSCNDCDWIEECYGKSS